MDDPDESPRLRRQRELDLGIGGERPGLLVQLLLRSGQALQLRSQHRGGWLQAQGSRPSGRAAIRPSMARGPAAAAASRATGAAQAVLAV